jgi:hypothetical protein
MIYISLYGYFVNMLIYVGLWKQLGCSENMFSNGVEQFLLMKMITCHLVQHLNVAYIIVLTKPLLYSKSID